jgi:ADP-ribose pyrophosphatase YjhB (NUDIX family)
MLGRTVTRVAATLTLGRMPPFASASALVPDGDRILAVIDPITGQPVFPGGHLKWREEPRAAVVREVREETGYEIMTERVLHVVGGEELTGEKGVVRIVYLGSVAGGALSSSPEGRACWLPASEMAASEGRDAQIVQWWLEE